MGCDVLVCDRYLYLQSDIKYKLHPSDLPRNRNPCIFNIVLPIYIYV